MLHGPYVIRIMYAEFLLVFINIIEIIATINEAVTNVEHVT